MLRGEARRWDTYNPSVQSQQPQVATDVDEEMYAQLTAHERAAEAAAGGSSAMECGDCVVEDGAEQQGAASPVRFVSHVEERAELGKPVWTDISGQVPRVQNDGRLAMRQGAAQRAADLEGLRRSFPSLPFIKPPPAAARAVALIDKSSDGVWTAEKQELARSYFECEAANIEVCLVAPKVTARDELIKHERYQVREGSEVVGCKLCCPGCGHNAFVLVGEVNVNSISNVRFAYGNGKAIMAVSSSYSCFNPSCPDVIAARNERQLAGLRALVAEGVTAANAKSRMKVTELRKLGVAWFGHDLRVMKALPMKVRSGRGEGGC